MDILKKIDDFLAEGAVPRTEKTVNMTHKTSGKEIVVTARSITKYEKLGYELNESTIKRFDDVHIVSKNKTGIVYDIKGNRVTVRTISGDITVNKSDVRLVSESSDDLNEMAKGDFAGWVAFYGGKRLEIGKDEAKDLYGAKKIAVTKLKVPMSKLGLLAIKPGYEE